jgi:anti-sigma regulatory factor (Ser/Thr protein kinase)
MNSDTSFFNYEISLSASLNELARLQTWVEEHIEGMGYPAKVCNQIALVTEEIFVNIARYAYPGKTGEAVIHLTLGDSELVMQFEDRGAAFNPLEYPEPDLKVPLEERNIGGLGIFITRKIMDNIAYTRTDEKNRLTLHKRIQ